MPQKHPLRRPQMRALQLNSLGVGRKQRQLMRWPGCLVLRLQQQQLWAELAATATPATSAATPSTTATSAAVGLSSLTSAPGQLQLMCSGYSAIHIFHTQTHTHIHALGGKDLYFVTLTRNDFGCHLFCGLLQVLRRGRAHLDFLHWFHRPAIIIVNYIVLVLAVEGP